MSGNEKVSVWRSDLCQSGTNLVVFEAVEYRGDFYIRFGVRGVKMVEGLRYKLRMMGIQVDGPTNMTNDNAAAEEQA